MAKNSEEGTHQQGGIKCIVDAKARHVTQVFRAGGSQVCDPAGCSDVEAAPERHNCQGLAAAVVRLCM
jgi:hypothetical protein